MFLLEFEILCVRVSCSACDCSEQVKACLNSANSIEFFELFPMCGLMATYSRRLLLTFVI